MSTSNPTRDQKVEAFRALHTQSGLFVIPNPWDAGTARILTGLGFEALATTSAGFAFSAGRRDSSSAFTREDVLDNARAIVGATHLPVSADLEDGFGLDPETRAATIRMAAGIGLAGGSIEDATGDAANPIFEFGLAVERVSAAATAAHTSGFVLTARAENYLYGRADLQDTIRRLKAFDEAGADVLYAPGLRTLGDIRAVCESVSKPVNVLMSLKGVPLSLEELAEAGVKRVSVGGSLARAAMGEFIRAAQELRDKGTFTYSDRAIPMADISAYMAEDEPAPGNRVDRSQRG